MAIDLVPFGFTPTESAAYGALIDLGPSSAYALAKAMGVARANGYQALDRLVAKGAAELVEERPRRYRAVRPSVLFAQLVEAQGRRLDALAGQIRQVPSGGADGVVPIASPRVLDDLVTRMILRGEGPVRVLVPPGLVEAITPALRARSLARGPLEVLVSGPVPDLPFPASTAASTHGPIIAVTTAGAALVATIQDGEAEGVWMSSRVLRLAVEALISELSGAR